jgi:DNA-binding transcriptional ArsR family regulator
MTEPTPPLPAEGDLDGQGLAATFVVLAEPTRLQMLAAICAWPGIYGVDLPDWVGKSEPVINHHLRVLHKAGLIRRKPEGAYVGNWVDEDAFGALADVVTSLHAGADVP